MINQIGGSSWCSGNWLAIVPGRVILENHLSALCLLISVGLVPEITTYFLGRGPAGGRQPSAYGMRLWTAYRVSSGLEPRSTVNCCFSSFPFISGNVFTFLNTYNRFFLLSSWTTIFNLFYIHIRDSEGII